MKNTLLIGALYAVVFAASELTWDSWQFWFMLVSIWLIETIAVHQARTELQASIDAIISEFDKQLQTKEIK